MKVKSILVIVSTEQGDKYFHAIEEPVRVSHTLRDEGSLGQLIRYMLPSLTGKKTVKVGPTNKPREES